MKEPNNNGDKGQAAIAAANLIKTTADQTATALNIQYIQRDIVEIKGVLKEMTADTVSKEDFGLFQKIVFGLVTVDIAIVGWLVNIAIRK